MGRQGARTSFDNDRDGWMYRETIIENGRPRYTMLADCHMQEGGE